MPHNFFLDAPKKNQCATQSPVVGQGRYFRRHDGWRYRFLCDASGAFSGCHGAAGRFDRCSSKSLILAVAVPCRTSHLLGRRPTQIVGALGLFSGVADSCRRHSSLARDVEPRGAITHSFNSCRRVWWLGGTGVGQLDERLHSREQERPILWMAQQDCRRRYRWQRYFVGTPTARVSGTLIRNGFFNSLLFSGAGPLYVGSFHQSDGRTPASKRPRQRFYFS